MDPIEEKKTQSMKSYKDQLLYELVIFSLTAFITSQLISNTYCFSFIRNFLFVLPPNIPSFISSPKFVFLVANMIIILILVQESKSSVSHQSPASQMYNEYVLRSRNYKIQSTNLANKKLEKELEILPVEESKQKTVDTTSSEAKNEEARVGNGGSKIVKTRKREVYVPTEELNKRAEDFIARVNRKWRLES